MVKDRKTVRCIHSEPQVRIGRSGIHSGVVQEIEKRLKEEGVIKIRVLRSYLINSGLDTGHIATEVAKHVRAEVVTVRGHVFVLRRRAARSRYRK